MSPADYAAKLLAMAENDLRTRARLAESGALFEGYHPEMQRIHDENAEALEPLLAEAGWPAAADVGADAQEAAWLVVQHAIAQPRFMRWAAELLSEAVAQGRAPAWQAAYLTDRIRTLEGRPQLFGTQFDWDEAGQMSPLPIEESEDVDTRRAEAGLPPLPRTHAVEPAEKPPADLAARRAEREAWRRAVGWDNTAS